MAAAKQRAEADREIARARRAKGETRVFASLAEEYYMGRSGNELFLWKGYSAEPCEHIRDEHGPECAVVWRQETDYGLLFDTCNCEPRGDGSWAYY